MATPKKVTMYETSFPDLKRSKVAVFTFTDGKVNVEVVGDKDDAKVFTSVIDPDTGKTVTPEDGERFMKALPRAFQMSTIFGADVED